MRITFISDTHNKHNQVTQHMPGGDLLIHAGDFSSMGYNHEVRNFCDWLEGMRMYDTKIFIAGNHDLSFEYEPEATRLLLGEFKKIDYLQDDLHILSEDYSTSLKVWGAPWQPRFLNWAFNADRGEDIKQHWDKISLDTDILITHGPPHGKLDRVIGRYDHFGCEELTKRIAVVKPKIHVFGHIHSGYGYVFDGTTHYFNAAVLDERYQYAHKPFNVEWNPETNEIEILD